MQLYNGNYTNGLVYSVSVIKNKSKGIWNDIFISRQDNARFGS